MIPSKIVWFSIWSHANKVTHQWISFGWNNRVLVIGSLMINYFINLLDVCLRSIFDDLPVKSGTVNDLTRSDDHLLVNLFDCP